MSISVPVGSRHLIARTPSCVSALPAMPRSVRIAVMASSGIQIGLAPLRCNMIPSG